jgi:acyl-CoA synthetase (AMP-forming)/AMP-acid ligase II
MDLGHVIERAGEQFGSRVLLTDSDGSMTFGDFEARTRLLAAALAARGLHRGERVALLLPNGGRLLEMLYGVIRAGLVAVPINTNRVRDLRDVLDDAGARLLCTTVTMAAAADVPANLEVIVLPEGDGGRPTASILSDGGPVTAGPSARCRDEDLAVLLYTSGTTGAPKGVMLSHANWLYAALGLVLALEVRADDVALLSTPVVHASGFLFLAHLLRGGRVVILSRWHPAEFLAALAEQRATTAFLVPTMLYGLLDDQCLAGADLSSLRVLYYSSAPIDPRRLRAALDVVGPRLAQSYGLIEAPMPATVLDIADHARILRSREAQRLLSSAGREFILAETAVVNEAGLALPRNEVGEVVVRGPHVMLGYWKKPRETDTVLRDGWLRTGDSGYRDCEGYLYLTDRKTDIIISGGVTVSAGRVERVLADHPAVSEVAVVAAPDDYWGEVPAAIVVPRPGVRLSSEQVLEYARTRLSGPDRPKRAILENSLPRNENGKLLRRQLRERLWQGRPRRVN